MSVLWQHHDKLLLVLIRMSVVVPSKNTEVYIMPNVENGKCFSNKWRTTKDEPTDIANGMNHFGINTKANINFT